MFGRVWVREVEAARCMVPVEVVDIELDRDFFGFDSLGCFRREGFARAVVIALQKMSYIDKGASSDSPFGVTFGITIHSRPWFPARLTP